jgi:hypothetical protein
MAVAGPAALWLYNGLMPGRSLVFAAFLLAQLAAADPRRILYVTATYGFRHSESIAASIQVMQDLAAESGAFEVVNTEDVSEINAENLRNFDAVYFFTSGELPLTDQQKGRSP